MSGFALPRLRWLLASGLAVGIWVAYSDSGKPRPPERVPTGLGSILSLPDRVAQPKARPDRPGWIDGRPPRPPEAVRKP
jgi:hypothetical protein